MTKKPSWTIYANDVYFSVMVIIETRIFTQRIKDLMSDDEYRELQETW